MVKLKLLDDPFSCKKGQENDTIDKVSNGRRIFEIVLIHSHGPVVIARCAAKCEDRTVDSKKIIRRTCEHISRTLRKSAALPSRLGCPRSSSGSWKKQQHEP